MDVSIVIVNYNTLQITLDCINSIFSVTIQVGTHMKLLFETNTKGKI